MDSVTAPRVATPAPSRSLLQTLDALPILLCNTFFATAGSRVKGMVCRAMSLGVVVALIVFFFYMVRKTLGLSLSLGGVTSEERVHSRAKYLVRESARLVASALEKRTANNLLDAYEDAAQAAVLARTAKEVDVDVARLTKDLGVDFHEYLSYTSTVLQDMRLQLRRGV